MSERCDYKTVDPAFCRYCGSTFCRNCGETIMRNPQWGDAVVSTLLLPTPPLCPARSGLDGFEHEASSVDHG